MDIQEGYMPFRSYQTYYRVVVIYGHRYPPYCYCTVARDRPITILKLLIN